MKNQFYYLPKGEYKGFVYSYDYDDVDCVFVVYFYYINTWKYFKSELLFRDFIDGLYKDNKILYPSYCCQ